ncbi:TetR/AcrR family transcriptional regulator [Nocardia sp. NPDC058640]|uniref:TetR/AcrR family transcriptional regulator n=1 Tax=Nocardia sp. NPDC058640 TaxID=3346571 RepID=UPI003660B125
MTSTDRRGGRPRKGTLDKRSDVLAAARRVFGRVGYVGASIDMIATEAEVSTRTIYNHFTNKEQLFAVALTESSQQVAAAHEAIIDRNLPGDLAAVNLESALIELATQWRKPDSATAEHFAVVRRIQAGGEDFPADLVDAWQEAGPRRVRRTLAEHFAALGTRGLLHIDDPAIAAQHYIALITTDWNSDAELEESVSAGVRTFLYGHLPRPATG